MLSSTHLEETEIKENWAQLPPPKMKSLEVGDASETRYKVEEARAGAAADTLKFFTQKKTEEEEEGELSEREREREEQRKRKRKRKRKMS